MGCRRSDNALPRQLSAWPSQLSPRCICTDETTRPHEACCLRCHDFTGDAGQHPRDAPHVDVRVHHRLHREPHRQHQRRPGPQCVPPQRHRMHQRRGVRSLSGQDRQCRTRELVISRAAASIVTMGSSGRVCVRWVTLGMSAVAAQTGTFPKPWLAVTGVSILLMNRSQLAPHQPTPCCRCPLVYIEFVQQTVSFAGTSSTLAAALTLEYI